MKEGSQNVTNWLSKEIIKMESKAWVKIEVATKYSSACRQGQRQPCFLQIWLLIDDYFEIYGIK